MNKTAKAYLMVALIVACYVSATLSAAQQQEKLQEDTQINFATGLENKHALIGGAAYILLIAWLYKSKGRDAALATIFLPLTGYILAKYSADNQLSS